MLVEVLLLCSLVPSIDAGAVDSAPDATRSIKQTFAITPGARVEVDHSLGRVDVKVWDRQEVKILAEIEARGETATEFVNGVQLVVEDSGHPFTVKTRRPEVTDDDLSYGIALVMFVPSGHDLGLSHSFGPASIEGVQGRIEAKVENGDLVVRRVDGELRLETTFGLLEVADSKGRARLKAASGDVRVRGLKEGAVEVHNSFGNVVIHEVDGDVEIHSTSGDIEVRDAKKSVRSRGTFGRQDYENIGGSLVAKGASSEVRATGVGGRTSIETTFGGVELESCRGEVRVDSQSGGLRARDISADLEAKLTFGEVDIEGVLGSCRVHAQSSGAIIRDVAGDIWLENTFGVVEITEASGDVVVDSQSCNITVDASGLGPKNELRCSTTQGLVEIRLPEQAAVELDLATTFGDIKNDFGLDVDEQVNGKSCRQSLGAPGGAPVTVRVQGGDIRVRRSGSRAKAD